MFAIGLGALLQAVQRCACTVLWEYGNSLSRTCARRLPHLASQKELVQGWKQTCSQEVLQRSFCLFGWKQTSLPEVLQRSFWLFRLLCIRRNIDAKRPRHGCFGDDDDDDDSFPSPLPCFVLPCFALRFLCIALLCVSFALRCFAVPCFALLCFALL